MKVSRYTIFLSDFPAAGKHLVFNTRTQAQVVIDDELLAILNSLPGARSGEKSAQALKTLEKMGILAGDGVDEDALIAEWFSKLRADNSLLKPIVLTTFSCNFACTYCVEEGVRDPIFMDGEAAQRTVSFIRERAVELGSRKIYALFYGGEPLLNLPAIRTVAEGLGRFSREAGLAFGFGVTTNGSLLTRPLVEELKGLGLAGLNVTLDGTRELHDAKRPFASGKGSFDLIIANLMDVIDLTSVDIIGNFDDENARDIPLLLDYLAGLGLQKKIRRVDFKPISRTPGDREGVSPSVELECAFAKKENAQRIVKLRRAARERGFGVEEGIGIHLCDAVARSSSFTVDPRGILYRCPGFVGRDRFSSGDVTHGERQGVLPELWRRCAACAYAPLCGDGCILDAYLRFGDPLSLSCHREAMELIVTETLKDGYLRSHKG